MGLEYTINGYPKIKISDAEIPLGCNPKLLGVYLDTFFSFNAHCVQVANIVSKRNNVLKELAGIGRHQLGTTNGNITFDIYSIRKIDC